MIAKMEQMVAAPFGTRVRAILPIFYADTSKQIEEGREGTIVGVTHGGALVRVMWDGNLAAPETSCESIEIVR